jgi:uncharacterized protein YceK
MWKKALILLPTMLLLAGCASTITNISAQRQIRNANNLYPLEVSLDSRQQTLKWDTVQPYVIMGTESYPMKPVKYMQNRWECVIPVPANVNSVTYHYKFDYQVNDFGGPKKSSASSHSYKLLIVEP